MVPRLVAALLLVATFRGCVRYEYEHEFWLKVDGSGSVRITGRPELWTAFKGLALDDRDPAAIRKAARALFEGSGLQVRKVVVVRRRGHRYLSLTADFADVNRISYTPAFPDLRLGIRRDDGRLELDGSWQRPLEAVAAGDDARDGLMAVRLHLPSKVYAHRRAAEGLERGNILTWRQETAAALDDGRIEFGAELDERSILFSTVMLFAGAVVLAVLLLSFVLWGLVRRGRRDLAQSP